MHEVNPAATAGDEGAGDEGAGGEGAGDEGGQQEQQKQQEQKEPRQFLVVVHVASDYAFKKFRSHCTAADLDLFRGLLLKVRWGWGWNGEARGRGVMGGTGGGGCWGRGGVHGRPVAALWVGGMPEHWEEVRPGDWVADLYTAGRPSGPLCMWCCHHVKVVLNDTELHRGKGGRPKGGYAACFRPCPPMPRHATYGCAQQPHHPPV